MVKREELVECIHSDEHEWSCPTSDGNCEFGDCRVCASIVLEEYEEKIKADAIDEVFKKLYDIRDSLPFKYSEHWTSRDSDAISTLFIEYEKQLKEQNIK